MTISEISSINTNEISRIRDIIKINDASLKPFFLDDIDLIKSDPTRYWNSFLLDSIDKDDSRYKTIRNMQVYYSQGVLFKLHE